MKIFAISVVFILLIVVVLSFRTIAQVRLVASRRKPISEDEFASALLSNGIPNEISRAIFKGFQRWASGIVQNFPVHPDDRVTFYIPIVRYDYEDIMESILRETKRCCPLDQSLPDSRNVTLKDIASFVARCPKTTCE